MSEMSLQGGFDDAPAQSAAAFRAVMNAMARPGEINDVSGATPPAPLSPAAGAVLLTLCDPETPLYLAGAHDCDAVRSWVAFHTGAPFVAPEAAVFAIGTWEALHPLGAYRVGTSDYPDTSATLIVESAALAAEGASLTGPGIKDEAWLNLPEIDAFQRNHALFPLGLDFIFAAGAHVAALPRSTQIQEASTCM